MSVTIIYPSELDGNGQINRPDVFLSWRDYDRHYLAEGDSWFALSDILSPSFLYRFGEHVPLAKNTLIVNCSHAGDELSQMVDWHTNWTFSHLLHDKEFGWEWDGVLLSAGGNDVIDAALANNGILRSCAAPTSFHDFIDYPALSMLKANLKVCFSRVVALRDYSQLRGNRDIPIYCHTYGYPTPRNSPASLGIGPWLFKAFTAKHIPVDFWQPLSNFLMDELASLIRGLPDSYRNICIVDTLKKVQLASAVANSTGSSGDWLNEIHLNDSGKDKIAQYWATFL